MACNECGSCLYSNDSTARVEVKITSGGFTDDCKPDKEMLYAALPYQGPGVWSKTEDGVTVTANSKCISGTWTWSKTGGGRKADPNPNCALLPPSSITENTVRNDCGGFHQVEVTLYPGKWVQVETKITVENNQECEP